ncbi:hypothetical protein N7510_011173 [Penicillium lagena]|uniref:uncharacterized protein n=1 Tax=Penicillium lagena TaxID=94218 RepID=UPI00254111D3|nr:uncharacterized protein N7510_011173 [Penicillium lagena]KAJ5601639.1 hypothetical protein N7510_011173 [Penicillium lagena]
MFSNRKNSQKPDDELISRFQRTFGDVVPRREPNGQGTGPLNEGAGDPMMPARYAFLGDSRAVADGLGFGDRMMENGDMKFPSQQQRTPRNLLDLNLTPSFMDPESLNMMNFAGQHPGFYTPNSGGMGAMWRSQAGDLHTPTLGLNSMTPLSLPIAVSNPQNALGHYNPQLFAQQMPGINMYAQAQQQSSFAPSAFMHRGDSGYDAMDETSDSKEMQMDAASNITASTDLSGQVDMSYADPSGEKFRFNVSLRAPTAMVKDAKEIPITYLNKGQAYNLSVMDANPPLMSSQPIQYRTYVRVSFDEEEQRSKPSTCWQLWKEGRGSSESHQRGGKLLAVEYVDPLQGGGEDPKHRQIHVEHASFDGFVVTWTANPATGTSDCSIPVRFNFLSTDFSHSKGVKGIPVRLCAKTQILSPGDDTGEGMESEVCYCKVKLFRDHGAERKLSNDIAHVKKTIEKLSQQIAQAEMGGGFGKRKRGSTNANFKGTDRSMKVKHKRTWSVSSQDGQSEKMSLEDDLHSKLAMMEAMFSSTRSISVLSLRGEEGDDPDLYPVRLPREANGDITKIERLDRQNTGGSQQSVESFILSPSNSCGSLSSPRMPQAQVKSHPVTIQRTGAGDPSMSAGYIEAIDIDPTYRPPAERLRKPIACFYVRFSDTETPSRDYYRAVYLTERTVRDLLRKIAEKHQIDPSRVVSVLHVTRSGLKIMVDDDVVQELPEGQDMVVDISEARCPDGTDADTDTMGVEMKLTY